MRCIAITLLILLQSSIGFSQSIERCGMTLQALEQMMEENEEYRLHHERWRKKIDKILAERGKNPSCTNGPIKIPVAIHFDSGIVPAAQEACAIDVTVDQINEMNNEIAGLDSDAGLINNFLSCFGSGILGDACIEFCIGQFGHPPGYGLLDGDYAITFGQVSFSVPSGNYTPVNADWADYINVYVDDLPGGLLGVANGIPGNFNGDGVLVDNCVFGTGAISCPGVSFTGASGCYTTYDEGETLAHELGHYLGLYHIWGDNFHCNGGQDMIADTPDMDDNYSGYLSCGNHSSCTDLPTSCGSEDMYMNFMSYAGDGCMYMFTSDQSDVMNATAVVEGFTTVSVKCLPPPVADFLPDTDIDLCNMDCVDFMDQSTNTPDSWDWSFTVQSGNIVLDIMNSTDQDPTVCVLSGNSGTVDIELIASNASGSDAEIKTLTIGYLNNVTYYADTDNDGYGDPNNTVMDCEIPLGYVTNSADCDDTDSEIHPGQTELCDGVDNNCDGMIDEECDCDGDFLVINTIIEDINRAEFTLMSDAIVNSGETVLFTAGDYIELDAGFEVVSGAEFDALIDNCVNNNIDSDNPDEVFKVRDLDLEQFEIKLLEQFDRLKGLEIEILDKDGRSMKKSVLVENEITGSLFREGLVEGGIYFLIIRSKDKELIKKMLFRI